MVATLILSYLTPLHTHPLIPRSSSHSSSHPSLLVSWRRGGGQSSSFRINSTSRFRLLRLLLFFSISPQIYTPLSPPSIAPSSGSSSASLSSSLCFAVGIPAVDGWVGTPDLGLPVWAELRARRHFHTSTVQEVRSNVEVRGQQKLLQQLDPGRGRWVSRPVGGVTLGHLFIL